MDERQSLFMDVCSNWGCHEQVMSDWAEATTMSMLGPVTCSALTVTDPLVPPDDLVCWLMITLIPPGREMERFGLETRIDWPATVNPTSCALPLVLACPPLQVALEFDFTTLAARSEEHTSELQSRFDLVCRLLLEKKKKKNMQ